MHTNTGSRRDPNPRKNAGLLSKILFLYTIKTFGKGCKRSLNEQNIYETLDYNEATKLGDGLEILWEKESQKTNPFILKPLFRMFWMEYTALGIGVFIAETILLMSQPILMGRIIAYFEQGQTEITRDEALLYSAGLVGCILMWRTYDNNYLFLLGQLSMRIRIACCSLMYRKCLKLNLNTTPQSEYGKMVNMMTKDVGQFNAAADMFHMICEGILQMMIMTYLMYRQMGVSTFSGVSLLVVLLIFHVYMGKLTATYRLKTAKKTDERVRATQEIFTAIRTIKMYTWERFFSNSVRDLRSKEISYLRILFIIKALALSVGQLSGMLAFYICIMTYIALGNHITAEKAYVVLGCFTTLRQVLTVSLPLGIAQIAEFLASIKRITQFLQLEEITESIDFEEHKLQQPRIIVKDVSIKSESDGLEILNNLNMDIISGITLIAGAIGSGKSTILKLLLGDVKETTGMVKISGAVAYASEEPWIFPGTVRQNILFCERYSAKRYETVIDICALRKDFDAFPMGDQTCVADRGLNLSRGQKSRINLARAIYKKADIYLLDDCLCSVDANVANHIFDKCIKDFLKHRICIFITHQLEFMKDVHNILILRKGHVWFQGKYRDLNELHSEELQNIANRPSSDVMEEFQVTSLKSTPDEVDEADESSKLLVNNIKEKNIYEEIRQEGSVKISVYYKYLICGGGVLILFSAVLLSIASQVASSWSDYYVSFWVDMERGLSGFRHNQTINSIEYKKLEESRGSVLTQYSAVILAASIFILLRSFIYFIFSNNASIKIHKLVSERIMNACMKFFDSNLSGNVINRFTRDLAIIDEQTAFVIFECLRTALSLFAVLFVVSTVNVLFLIPSVIFLAILYFAQRLYLPTGRSLRRLEGSTRSPLVGHLSATLEGLTTIRASRAQHILIQEFDKHQDLYNSVSYMNLATTRAFIFYIGMLSAFFMATATLTFIFHSPDTFAGKVGLALSQTFSLNGILQWGVQQWVELETQMTSTERVLEYTQIGTENKSGSKLANWPVTGKIVYHNINLSYSPTSEKILKNVSFVIEPKEKFGVVGRTGAGKTSIISSLFRLYEYEGSIIIDGVDIKSVEVELLRSKISIIAQEPVLFAGSIRSNLDPYGKSTDLELWNALEEVEIKHLIQDLDLFITEGGSIFSTGQRQLLCIARAILSKNTILVLDEATANVDAQTGSLIHKTIRRKFSNCTVITIAHRLRTILDYDKVLVMDSGMVIEHDAPSVLLKNQNGVFYRMVKEAGLLNC